MINVAEISCNVLMRREIQSFLTQSKLEFGNSPTLENFNRMRKWSKEYQELNDKIYTYENIMYFESLIKRNDNSFWKCEEVDSFLSKNEVVLDIRTTNDLEDVLITLSVSKNNLPMIKTKGFRNEFF